MLTENVAPNSSQASELLATLNTVSAEYVAQRQLEEQEKESILNESSIADSGLRQSLREALGELLPQDLQEALIDLQVELLMPQKNSNYTLPWSLFIEYMSGVPIGQLVINYKIPYYILWRRLNQNNLVPFDSLQLYNIRKILDISPEDLLDFEDPEKTEVTSLQKTKYQNTLLVLNKFVTINRQLEDLTKKLATVTKLLKALGVCK